MTLEAALISCTVLGLQHGVDWDHVAAISDIASTQPSAAEASRCGMLYALGHAATVSLIGIALIGLHQSLPPEFAIWMQRVVGGTLIVFGFYVLATLLSGGAPVSRGQAILRLFGSVHRHETPVPVKGQPCGPKSSLSLGVLHGIGAETPTQLSMLLIASNLGGFRSGVLGLLVFATAMFVANLFLTTVATSVFSISKLKPMLFRWLGVLTAGYSLWIGAVLVRS
jgi:high-affinity nickel-transport protein